MNSELISKVLVLDNSPLHAAAIKTFCDDNRLVGLKVGKDRLMSVLRSNIDLGAILYSESYGETAAESTDIARRIRSIRPELPIMLRRDEISANANDNKELQGLCCTSYSTDDLAGLSRAIDEFIFSLVYPNALVRGISELTLGTLGSQFSYLTASVATPYIVRDRVIFGEVFSLIPIEGSWCRGYMTLQTEEQPILDILDVHQPRHGGADFRTVNSLLGELTNLIWGAFKSRFLVDEERSRSPIQVPLIVNHRHRFISFGTENPQLCFLYTLTDAASGRSFKLYQRFVFNLSWSPEQFREIAQVPGEVTDAGELEMF
jgi:hypothetical protein